MLEMIKKLPANRTWIFQESLEIGLIIISYNRKYDNVVYVEDSFSSSGQCFFVPDIKCLTV